MTTHILHVTSSIFGAQGQSSLLTNKILSRLTAQYPGAKVAHRDLVTDPLPHFSADYVQALAAAPEQLTGEQKQLVGLGNALIDEVKAADVLVIAAPMYNFGVPSTLKAWFDYLARAGTTFKYTATGPEGLLDGKKAIVVTTRGGMHQGKSTDSEVPFIKTFLGFLGITDVEFVYAEGLNMSNRDQGLKHAEQQIAAISI